MQFQLASSSVAKASRTSLVVRAQAKDAKVQRKAVTAITGAATTIAAAPALAFKPIIENADTYVPHMTPSLAAFLNSCVWGALVLSTLWFTVLFFANTNPIRKYDP